MNKLAQKSAACALALAFLSPLLGSSLYFQFTQGTGTQSNQQTGDTSIDNPSMLGSANNVSSPAIYVSMLYFSPWGSALFEVSANTNVSAGTYLVGDFKDMYGNGADVYASIY